MEREGFCCETVVHVLKQLQYSGISYFKEYLHFNEHGRVNATSVHEQPKLRY